MPSNEPPANDRGPLTVTPLAPGRWGASLRHPDGALLAAVAISAVAADTGDALPMSATAHFVSPAVPGPLEIRVGHIDRTARHTTADATVEQGGRVVARLLITSRTSRGEGLVPDTPAEQGS